MNVAGLDFNWRQDKPGKPGRSFVDIVTLTETNEAEWSRHELPTVDPFDACQHTRHALPTRSWWEDRGILIVGIEDLYSHNRHTLKQLALIEGAIVATIPKQIAVMRLGASTWKREFTGDGKADKERVHWRAVLRCHSAEDWPNDASDAYGLAWAARAINDRQEAA